MVNRALVPALAALFLFGLFSPEIIDTDFWWHLRTGQYIVDQHRLPVPDLFAWTTARAPLAYPTEARTRQFNLTHEWLAQVAMFATWRVGGFAGVVFMRAMLMTLTCGLIGLIVWRRTASIYGAIAGALACASVLYPFALDRPYQVTFLFVAATLAILEFRRFVWGLPVLFLIWANCHAGFFLGFIVLGAHCGEALWRRSRERTLWLVSAACVVAAAINPNGFGVFRALLDYRSSYMQSRLLEWSRPSWVAPFSALLLVAVLMTLWQRRRARVADALILLAFGAAAFTALRNTPFAGLIAPIVIAGCWPWKWRVPEFARTLLPAVAVAVIGAGLLWGSFFQLRAAEWRFPKGAADFLNAHQITAPLFNTYEHGGYLIWRNQRVFIDGRALSESLFMDYARILYNHENNDGLPSGDELLDRYGVGAIVMNTMEPSLGNVYVLAPALADPTQKKWKLVYQDAQSVIFLRDLPPGVPALNSLDVFAHMESECHLYLDHQPQYPRCARSVGEVFLKIGDRQSARRWLGIYLEHLHGSDPQAEQAYQSLLAQP